MSRSRSARGSARRAARLRKSAKRAAKPAARRAARPVAKSPATLTPQTVLYRLCRPPWTVEVERAPRALGTRFVCPFCPRSHRVPGPVRGFRKVRRAQWVKLRRVGE